MKKTESGNHKTFIYVLEDNPYYAFLFSRLIKKAINEDSKSFHRIYPCYGIRFKEPNLSKYPKWAKKIQIKLRYLGDEFRRFNRVSQLMRKYLLADEYSKVSFVRPWIWFKYLFFASLDQKMKFTNVQGNPCNAEFSLGKYSMGDLLIDSYIRYSGSARFIEEDSFNKDIITRAKALYMMYSVMAKNQYIVTAYSTYIQHGIPLRTALSQKSTGITFGDYQIFYKLHTYEKNKKPSHLPSHSEFSNEKARSSLSLSIIEDAKSSLESRINGIYDKTMSYMNKDCIPQVLSNQNSLSGSVVMYLHDFFDSPHLYEWMLFTDFWDWAYSTIDYCAENHIELAIKPHPNQFKESEHVLTDLMSIFKDKECIQWLDQSTSNPEILSQTPSLIATVYGSIAAEATYAGIKVLLAGDHPGRNFKVGYIAKSKDDYFQCIRDSSKIEVGNAIDCINLTALNYEPSYSQINQSVLSKFSLSFSDISNNPSLYQTKNAIQHIDHEISELYTKLEAYERP